jgi:hypothetical protein
MRIMAAPNSTGQEARNCSIITPVACWRFARFWNSYRCKPAKEASTMALRVMAASVEASSARAFLRIPETLPGPSQRSSQVQFTFLCERITREECRSQCRCSGRRTPPQNLALMRRPATREPPTETQRLEPSKGDGLSRLKLSADRRANRGGASTARKRIANYARRRRDAWPRGVIDSIITAKSQQMKVAGARVLGGGLEASIRAAGESESLQRFSRPFSS